MSIPILTVENLSKAYRIGLKEAIPDTMVGAIAGFLTAPFRNFHRLRRLNTYSLHTSAPEPATTPLATNNPRLHNNASQLDVLWALRDVSFDVQEGEVLGIIGRNGAGKSTLLKILSRITDPTAGQVVIRGRVSSLLEVGTGFHPEMTGRENIYMNGTILGMRKHEIDRKFDEIVDFSGVERFLDTPVKRYSSGMTVRLAFSVAAHLEPEILIIDEVLAVGDAEFQKKCLGKMSDVANSGRTVLFVSHNMAAVERLCQRGAVIRDGRIVFLGGVNSAIEDYLSNDGQSMNVWSCHAPFPERPHLRRVCLVSADGQPCVTPTSSSHFGVMVEFAIPYRCPGLFLGLAVQNSMEYPLFSTSPLDSEECLPAGPGVYRCSVLFPPGILMPKQYGIRVAMYDLAMVYDSLANAFTFQVTESASLANKVSGGRVGDLQIMCRWSECIGQP